MFIYAIRGHIGEICSGYYLVKLYLPNRIRTLELITHGAVREPRAAEREREERTNFAHNFVFVYINMNFTTRSQLVLKDDSHIPH